MQNMTYLMTVAMTTMTTVSQNISTNILSLENIQIYQEKTAETTTHNTTNYPQMFDILKTYQDYNTAMGLIKWIMPLIIVIGTVGNIFSFIIMVRREMRQTPTFFYLAMLAIADTIVLYVSAFKTWLRTIFLYEISHINNFSCKFTMFLVHFSIQFSAWLIVAVTIERFLAVWFPLKANAMCNLTRAKFVTFMIAVIFILVNIHIFWTAELVNTRQSFDNTNVICTAYAYENFVCRIFPWINLVLYSFLPCLVLLVFNILIIICLLRSKHVASTMTKDDYRVRSNHRKLANTLIFISIAWIITTTPRPLFTLFGPKPQSYEDMANGFLWRVVFFQLMYTNHAINFFLYCLSGEKFRVQFKKFVCQQCNRRKPAKTRLTFKSSGSGSTSGPVVYSSIPQPAIEISVFD